MRKVVFWVITILILPAQCVHAQEMVGAAARKGSDQAINWGLLTAGTAVMGTIVGFIFYLADSDPTQFSHTHSH